MMRKGMIKRLLAFTVCLSLLMSGNTKAYASEMTAAEPIVEETEISEEEIMIEELTEEKTPAEEVETEAVEETKEQAADDADIEAEADLKEVEEADEVTEEEDTTCKACEEDPCVCEIIKEKEEAKENMMRLLPEGAKIPENCTEVYTFIDENEAFEVYVCAPENALPENAVLKAELLSEDSIKFKEAEEMISQERTFDGLVALDVHFEVNGEEMEPSEPVYVYINFVALLPENADPESVAVVHIKEDEKNTPQSVELVADESDYTGIVTTETNEDIEALDVNSAFLLDSFSILGATYNAGDLNALAGGMTSDTYLNISSYNADCKIYYDEFTSSGPKGTDGNTISTVTLGGTNIIRDDSDTRTGAPAAVWANGYLYGSVGTWKNNDVTVGSIYGKNSAEAADLVIQPKDGYYVKRVVVACTPQFNRNSTTPYHCWTWEMEHAYDENMEVAVSGQVTIEMSVLAFCHLSSAMNGYNGYQSDNYFILIETAPLPSPLYVEYDYGIIVDKGADETVFKDPDMWTQASEANVYKNNGESGAGGLQTEDTQMVYTYVNSANAALWKHTSNTITAAGTSAAAAAGYRFTGWKAQYYVDVTTKNEQDARGNSYTYTFSNEYGSEFDVGADVPVQLATNLRLVAQWETVPTGSLTIKKDLLLNEEVKEGTFNFELTSAALANQKFTIQGEDNSYVEFNENGAASIAVDSGSSKTILGIPAGTEIQVKETDAEEYTVTYQIGREQEISGNQAVVSVKEQETVQVYFKNTIEQGDLTISKIAKVNDTEQKDVAFKFELTSEVLANKTFVVQGEENAVVEFNENGVANIEVNSGSSKTILSIPAGVEIVVKEIEHDGYAVSYTIGDETEEGDTAAVSIEKNNAVEVAFLNTMTSGVLYIQKDVYFNGIEGNESCSTFDFMLESEELAGQEFSIDGTDTFVTFDENGVATLTVTTSEPVQVKGLPIGAEIVVTEVNYSGYTPSVSLEEDGEFEYTDTVTVTIDSIISVYFRNEIFYELPATGGIGTTSFTFIGCALMIAASALYFMNRKKAY